MRVLIDTCVIIDALQSRVPFAETAQKIFIYSANIRLSTKETNTTALSMYRKAGFCDTGEMNDEEIVLQLHL